MLQRLNSTANFFTTMEISERNLLGKSVYLALFFGVRFAFFPYEDKNQVCVSFTSIKILMYARQKSLGHLTSTYDLPIEHRLIVFSVCLPEKARKGSTSLKLKVFDICSQPYYKSALPPFCQQSDTCVCGLPHSPNPIG